MTTTRQKVKAPIVRSSRTFPVIVVGAGQAGLSVSHELTALGIDHVVLERARIGQTWRDLWDSFCLVTPNWTLSLPGAPYAGDHPEGFAPRDEIVRYLERYASSFGAPIREGVAVNSLEPGSNGGLLLRTSAGDMQAESVVVCTGAFQRPHRPDAAAGFPPEVVVIDAEDYHNPAALAPGKVLVVGSGQTGCQISEELHESGRDVYLACGRAPWAPRRANGSDIVTWLKQTTFLETPLSALPSPAARLAANLQTTGHRGGHDLHYRTLQAMGVQLLGRLTGVQGHRAYFADDLADSVAFGDARYADLRQLLTEQLPAKGMAVPELPDPPPFHTDPPRELKLKGIGAVILTSGFRPDYAHWIRFPAFDATGFPLTDNGASMVVPGLFFCGVHFLRKRKSGFLVGVGEDATIVARSMPAIDHTTARPAPEHHDAAGAQGPSVAGCPPQRSAWTRASGASKGGSSAQSSITCRGHPYRALAASAVRTGVARSWRPQTRVVAAVIRARSSGGIGGPPKCPIKTPRASTVCGCWVPTTSMSCTPATPWLDGGEKLVISLVPPSGCWALSTPTL
ncbi:MAG TPA: NAD(P)/FAD-dependent oxidoreductase [Pseudonocardiaceae bacterium]